ncbi:MAG: TonB-dependent receptor [Bacteroidales bacterium]|nr:TonB-dependent receptor [Bacteroidales bacterium]
MRSFIKSFIAVWVFSLIALVSYGQTATTIRGKVVDTSGESVIGANIYLKGTTVGTVADLEGNFVLRTQSTGEQILVVSFVGMLQYETPVTLRGGDMDLGQVEMKSDAVGLAEVSVFANIALDRKTPVPVSNILPEMIETRLGMQEYPEILKSTPGVYATKQGGAFGDSRINIRGFNARNSAVMINGVPVNDMENGWVYWSNWAGLSEVTRTMQVQRGLGASRIAIPSVGGTINILTKTTDAEAGGSLLYGLGNDGYQKIGFTLSSGLTDDNWATTISLAKSQGDGYVDGTQFESYSYYLNISKLVNDNHRIAFSLFGAPQWHGQRSTRMYIDTYKDPLINSTRYNSDWGYKNGEVFYVRKNYYHKPMAILNHFWDVNSRLNVSTAGYLSIGTGGGTGFLGVNKFYDPAYLRENQPDVDRIVDENIARGANGAETILRSSINNHFWTGLISTASYNMDWLDLIGGVDIRYYKGEHYREVTDLLGGEYFLSTNDINNPNKAAFVGDIVDYYNDGNVLWEGVFGQAEAVFGDLSAFASAAISNKSYNRVEYLLESHDGNGVTSPWYNYMGYSAKAGANYNLTSVHNVFVNAGYFENQPDFRTVFYNYTNDANADAPNEKVMSFELGYGFRTGIFAANLNAYYTTWKDKSRVFGYTVNGVDQFANMTGINARHQGIEFDFSLKPIRKLSVTGMLSVGDWRWMNNLIDVEFFDDSQNLIMTRSVYIKDIHVGDAAQVTAAASVSYELLAGMKVGADWNYYDKLFAYFNPEDRTTEPADGMNPDAWEMPSYQLMDLFMSYRFNLGDYRATLVGNVNNLFDVEYISDATDGGTHDWTSARVYYGWGRSWMISLKLNF